MGKQGADACRALLAGEAARAVPPAWVGVGFAALTCKSPRLLLSVRALQRAVPYPHPRVSRLSPIRMGTLSRVIQAVASSLHWRPPGNPASSLSMGFD